MHVHVNIFVEQNNIIKLYKFITKEYGDEKGSTEQNGVKFYLSKEGILFRIVEI